MELGTFAPRPREDMVGDQLQAKEAVDKPLIVFVREHRHGIKTKFNQDPSNTRTYKAEGTDGVVVDAADVSTDEVWIDVLWLNGAIVDNLAPYVGQAVPIKLVWQAPANGGNSYIVVAPLTDTQLVQAQQWAAANSTRFDTEREQRRANLAAHETEPAPTNGGLAPVPMGQGTPTPMTPAPAAGSAALNPNDPAVAALLAQLAAQQNTTV
jgi:hypothetical protein